MIGKPLAVFSNIEGINENKEKIKSAEKKEAGCAWLKKQEGMNENESGKQKWKISSGIGIMHGWIH